MRVESDDIVLDFAALTALRNEYGNWAGANMATNKLIKS